MSRILGALENTIVAIAGSRKAVYTVATAALYMLGAPDEIVHLGMTLIGAQGVADLGAWREKKTPPPQET